MFDEMKRKIIFFQESMAGKPLTKNEGDTTDLGLKKVPYCQNLSKIAKDGKLDRAYMVLTSEFKLDLAEMKKDVYVADLVLHKVLQGESASIERIKRGTMQYKIEGKETSYEPCNVFWCDRYQSELQKIKEAKEKAAFEEAKKKDPTKKDQTKPRRQFESELMPRCENCIWCATQHIKDNYIAVRKANTKTDDEEAQKMGWLLRELFIENGVNYMMNPKPKIEEEQKQSK